MRNLIPNSIVILVFGWYYVNQGRIEDPQPFVRGSRNTAFSVYCKFQKQMFIILLYLHSTCLECSQSAVNKIRYIKVSKRPNLEASAAYV